MAVQVVSRTGSSPRFEAAFLHPRYWHRWVLLALVTTLMILPRSVHDALADGIGTLAFRFNHKRRRFALINLGLCFPEMSPSGRTALAHRHFQAHYGVLLDLPALLLGSRRRLQRLINVEGDEHIERSRRSGRGVVVLTGHSSAVDIGVIGLNLRYPLAGFYNSFKDPWADWLVYRVRTRFGTRAVARSQGFRPLIRAGREGSVLYYVADEDLGATRTVFAEFFGQQKATISVLGRLAGTCDADVIPSYAAYDSRTRRYTVHLLPAMTVTLGASAEEDARAMNSELEELIRLSPEQYMWTLRLFKTRPGGERSPYKPPLPQPGPGDDAAQR